MLTNTSTLPVAPYPNVPYSIYKEWCMGDSIDVFNANFANFDERLITLTLSSEDIKNQLIQITPPGAIMSFARTTAPLGWLVCDGSKVDVSLYPRLLDAIYVGDISNTSTNRSFGYRTNAAGVRMINGMYIVLPDLRGYFVRGYGTNTNGVSSTTFGVKQTDSLQSHVHTYGYRDDTNNNTDKGLLTGNLNVVTNPIDITNATGSPITDSSYSGVVRVSSETRPVNIPLLYCIKY